MLFSKTIISLAVLASAAVASISWTSTATLKCARANWPAIKANGDALLPLAPQYLNAQQLATLRSLLGGKSTLPSNPSDTWLMKMPSAFPPAILDLVAGNIISRCLA